ncbi:hypothetical protein ASPZODRAFT_127941 [Penicilliopsis zonata CBS 506.65]|uniref:Threonylcarbamoyl-AMP synthase n=1 Tax=Penicilliopsis zonata CBS 506.65 TaxID=1073090 RepID=A0A1L9SXC8_9EURO|nr:hypothetical protein ASPZODRAFT_127941 [Penicilliopsis zonata CBS 506.65]OJJ51806.1 hypothetical protein ASPZODRAFT_127941 [Penicilliopsis zonata CBS 506.65]
MTNYKTDALQAFQILSSGGIAILPFSVGYGVVATDPTALHRIFTTKQRGSHKRHAMLGSYALHREIHLLPDLQLDMVRTLTVDLDLPLGVVAPFRVDHPLIRKLEEYTVEVRDTSSSTGDIKTTPLLSLSSMNDTLSMLVNAGPLPDELVRLTSQAGLPLMGSSANLSGQGTKVRVSDIEPEILAAADIVLDYGLCPLHWPRASSTMFDFKTMRVIRFGACYDVVQDALRRFYGLDLPDDPGKQVLFSGRTNSM